MGDVIHTLQSASMQPFIKLCCAFCIELIITRKLFFRKLCLLKNKLLGVRLLKFEPTPATEMYLTKLPSYLLQMYRWLAMVFAEIPTD